MFKIQMVFDGASAFDVSMIFIMAVEFGWMLLSPRKVTVPVNLDAIVKLFELLKTRIEKNKTISRCPILLYFTFIFFILNFLCMI